MGDPEFKIRELIKRENIRVFSSNYALYGDLSRRVGDCLSSMVPTVETYSIDESFLNLGEFNEREVEPLSRELRERVHRWVGIPTCVGIAPTKTLAKVANFIAKKRPQYRSVCDLRSSQVRAELLPTVPVDEVWGIGAASAAKLVGIGVRTAADLAALDADNARALMTVTGGRTVYELRGISCLPLELMEPTRKGIAVTRSFGAPVTSWESMRVHEDEDVLSSHLVPAHLLRCPRRVACDRLPRTPSTMIRSTRTEPRPGVWKRRMTPGKWWLWPSAWVSVFGKTAFATRSAA